MGYVSDRPSSKVGSAVGYGLVLFFLAFVFIGGWALQSHLEARAYERVTGKRVSTWDAMFLDLRVQEPAR